MTALTGHQRAESEPDHEEAGETENQRLTSPLAARGVTSGDGQDENQDDPVENMKAVAQPGPTQQQRHAHQGLQHKDELSHDESRSVAATDRLPAQIADQAPAGHDQRDQDACPKESLMEQKKQISAIQPLDSTAAIAASRVSSEFLKLSVRRAASAGNQATSSISESWGVGGTSDRASTRKLCTVLNTS